MTPSSIQEGGCTRPKPPKVEKLPAEQGDILDPALWADFTAASALTCLAVGAGLNAVGIEVWAMVSWLFGIALGVGAAAFRVKPLPRIVGVLAAVVSALSGMALVMRILGGH